LVSIYDHHLCDVYYHTYAPLINSTTGVLGIQYTSNDAIFFFF
jgi:hypothetical protein